MLGTRLNETTSGMKNVRIMSGPLAGVGESGAQSRISYSFVLRCEVEIGELVCANCDKHFNVLLLNDLGVAHLR